MDDSLALDALRRRIAVGDPCVVPCAWRTFTTGNGDLDAVLGRGLAQGRLHEFYAPQVADAASSTGFAAMLALRVKIGPVAWLRTEAAERAIGQLYMPGLAEAGGDPASLILIMVPDDRMLLRAAADAAACQGLAVLIVECWGKAPLLTLTASRRLALAAEKSGVTLFLLRIGAEPAPSAATTRWSITAAPSVALTPDAPGHGMVEVELLRQRSGPAGMRWQMEWNRDERAFRKPALPGAVAALAEHRTADADRRDTLRFA
ncbi:hypothetical protein J4558_16540 [Leptolyngbya sp. 15MV]|nr:hypothetical protein J4558_16540 [Leptolyngbya sp. 15MV]